MPSNPAVDGSPSALSPNRDHAADTDPLLHLHKMSITAGVGNEDYVEVNTLAVLAVLFGLASSLAFMTTLLLVIPLAGLLLAIIALIQIRNSNGTQTGKFLAWAGLVLCIGISGFLIGTEIVTARQHEADNQAIADLSAKFGDDIHGSKLEQAYALFDDDFHTRVTYDQFRIHAASFQRGGVLLPAIESISWNGLTDFHDETADSAVAETYIVLHFGDSGTDRMDARFKRTGSTWQIDNIPIMFPAIRHKTSS